MPVATLCRRQNYSAVKRLDGINEHTSGYSVAAFFGKTSLPVSGDRRVRLALVRK
jgi:hypothetical protein